MRHHGTKQNDGTRASALWGRGGRGLALLSVFALFAIPVASASPGSKPLTPKGALVPSSLLAAAQLGPDKTFSVLVQSTRGNSSAAAGSEVGSVHGTVKRQFRSVSAVSASLSGKELLKLAKHPGVLAITPDVKLAPQDYQDSSMWRESAGVAALADPAAAPSGNLPAIAIVDSGIDATKTDDFGDRVVESVNLASTSQGATGDQEGHGTMVAGVAAGASADHPGAAPTARLVDVRTSDANGMSLTSDVIAATDWILANKDRLNIRVANFSLAGTAETSFQYDPLDKAVERLWFSGVVVVTAAGNHGTGGAVPMVAPGNDPFVITVGALDQNQTADPSDDALPAWSAYGTTLDGFHKPDLSAPGRYMVMPVPADATIPQTVPDRVVAPGYMWMSGTSFSAPIVSGAAAQIFARHPDWTPDLVKGALMESAHYLAGPGFGAGVGEVDGAAAAALASPPNANGNLDAFVTADAATGASAFDAAAWNDAVAANPSWTQASWASASWASASWASASWASASWASASWASASWASASWASASWASASWAEYRTPPWRARARRRPPGRRRRFRARRVTHTGDLCDSCSRPPANGGCPRFRVVRPLLWSEAFPFASPSILRPHSGAKKEQSKRHEAYRMSAVHSEMGLPGSELRRDQ
ncbi:MAG: serine protease AprX, partial [Gaiellaceae bacterium]|nr:serine protease AprX [Gaiellaceae bacterium]